MASKYAARKVEIDGIRFDSKMEGNFYLHLKALAEKGEVVSIVPHPSFELQPGFHKNGHRYRPINYVADFGVVYADGRRVVYDVKGAVTPTFAVKKKLYALRYHEPLVMVAFKKGEWIEWM